VAKSARILGKAEDAAYYGRLADEIRDAFQREYFTPSGRLAVDTMTAHVVALYMDLTPAEAVERTRDNSLNERENRADISKDSAHAAVSTDSVALQEAENSEECSDYKTAPWSEGDTRNCDRDDVESDRERSDRDSSYWRQREKQHDRHKKSEKNQ
jgi:hypothetical protein